MSFVPVTPYVPPPPSRRARELGERIRGVIEDYRRQQPETSSVEVHQALRLAADAGPSRKSVALIVVGVLIAVGIGAALLTDAPAPRSLPEIGVALVAIAIVVIGVIVITRLRG